MTWPFRRPNPNDRRGHLSPKRSRTQQPLHDLQLSEWLGDVVEEEGACHPPSFVRLSSVFTSSLGRKVGSKLMSATPTVGQSSGLRPPLILLAISASPQRNLANPIALDAEVTNISSHCLRVLVDDEELAIPFSEFPWFRSATIDQVLNVVRPSGPHLYWPDLDVNLSLDSSRHPDRYPLKAKF